MIRINSEQELLGYFRQLDQQEVELPETLRFPMLMKDYLAWAEPSGNRVFLVFTDPNRRAPMGIVFRRDSSGGENPPMMCEFCHSVRAGNGVTLLTAAVNQKKRVGLHLCRDLSCKHKMDSEPGADDFAGAHGVSDHERKRRIAQRMTTFARQNLF